MVQPVTATDDGKVGRENTPDPGLTSLTLTRRIKAPPAKVWAAWTNSQKLTQWFGPSDAAEGTARAELEVRVGGRFCISFKSRDGEYNQVSGVYRVVEPDERLVFSWAWHTTPERESQVEVRIRPDGDGTLLTLIHDRFANQAARDNHLVGWNEALDNFESQFI